MPLNKSGLANAIEAAFLNIRSNNAEGNSSAMIRSLASQLADAIDTYVKTGEVMVTALPSTVNVVGSAGPSTNPAPIPVLGSPIAGTGGLT